LWQTTTAITRGSLLGTTFLSKWPLGGEPWEMPVGWCLPTGSAHASTHHRIEEKQGSPGEVHTGGRADRLAALQLVPTPA
jgi:hypothetical protein